MLTPEYYSIAINVNTTSPARQQIHGFDYFTDAQLVSILESAYSTSMQCPTELYIAMVHISRLRAALASGASKPDQPPVGQQVRRIFDSIAHFNADDWAKKPMFKDKADAVAALGRIFAIAVRLYGIMTLPKSAIVSWALSSELAPPAVSCLELYDTIRTWQRDELLALARQSWHQLMHKTSLCWPLIVAGVAVADGSAEDQDFIERSLLSIWSLPNTSACLIIAIRKLRPFWASRKTAWEDCFDKPLACVA